MNNCRLNSKISPELKIPWFSKLNNMIFEWGIVMVLLENWKNKKNLPVPLFFFLAVIIIREYFSASGNWNQRWPYKEASFYCYNYHSTTTSQYMSEGKNMFQCVMHVGLKRPEIQYHWESRVWVSWSSPCVLPLKSC